MARQRVENSWRHAAVSALSASRHFQIGRVRSQAAARLVLTPLCTDAAEHIDTFRVAVTMRLARLCRSLLALILFLSPAVLAAITGGFGDMRTPSPGDHVTQVILKVRAEAEAMAGQAFHLWEPIGYTTQVRTHEGHFSACPHRNHERNSLVRLLTCSLYTPLCSAQLPPHLPTG